LKGIEYKCNLVYEYNSVDILSTLIRKTIQLGTIAICFVGKCLSSEQAHKMEALIRGLLKCN